MSLDTNVLLSKVMLNTSPGDNTSESAPFVCPNVASWFNTVKSVDGSGPSSSDTTMVHCDDIVSPAVSSPRSVNSSESVASLSEGVPWNVRDSVSNDSHEGNPSTEYVTSPSVDWNVSFEI